MRIEIHTLVTHPNPHADEMLGDVLLRNDGWRKYKGLRRARVEFVGDSSRIDAAEELTKGRLCFGIGGGPYDEHNKRSKKCCSQLIAEDLGLYGTDAALTRVVDWIRHADRTRFVEDHEWPTLIKGWHRLASPDQVYAWGVNGLMALYRYERNDAQLGEPSFTMNDLAKDFSKRHGDAVQRHRGLKRIHKMIQAADGATHPPLSLFNIINVWQKMYPNESHGAVRSWANRHLDHMAELAKQFQAVYDSYQPWFRNLPIMQPNGRSLKCVVEKTDNPDVAKVARVKGADIVIVQNSVGNIRVLANSNKNPTLDLSQVAAMIRLQELFHRKMRRTSELENRLYLEQAETIPEVPQWYYLQAGQLILNGSDQSSQGVEPTVLSLGAVYDIVHKHARLNPALAQANAS